MRATFETKLGKKTFERDASTIGSLIEISHVHAHTVYSGEWTYQQLLYHADNDDEYRHLQALISARGVKLTDKVDEGFWDVLMEEGYENTRTHIPN